MSYRELEKLYMDASLSKRSSLLGDRNPDDVDYDEWLVIVSVSHRAGLEAIWKTAQHLGD